MNTRAKKKVDLREGEYRGEWTGTDIVIEFTDREITIPVDKESPREDVPVVVVVVGGYLVAETLYKEEE